LGGGCFFLVMRTTDKRTVGSGRAERKTDSREAIKDDKVALLIANIRTIQNPHGTVKHIFCLSQDEYIRRLQLISDVIRQLEQKRAHINDVFAGKDDDDIQDYLNSMRQAHENHELDNRNVIAAYLFDILFDEKAAAQYDDYARSLIIKILENRYNILGNCIL
jgi:hypothetical protein